LASFPSAFGTNIAPWCKAFTMYKDGWNIGRCYQCHLGNNFPHFSEEWIQPREASLVASRFLSHDTIKSKATYVATQFTTNGISQARCS
jgi:hypothetical protein